jgi:hypothetical protein
MSLDWTDALARLKRYPEETHLFRPPCPDDRIQEVELALGSIPEPIKDMLRRFNGARLFMKYIQMITVFGVSVTPAPPEFDWGPEYWIDKYTPVWRETRQRPRDWVIAVSNYGGISVLQDDGRIREWDTGAYRWGPMDENFDDWIERILKEGDEYMNEPD